MQKKELFLWTCSTNQANPQCVTARRLTEAHPWEVTKGKKSFLCWIWEEVAPALSFMGLLPLALLSSPLPSACCSTQASLAFGAIPPLPSTHHHLLTTTPHSSAPIPCPPQIHSPLCHFIPSAVTLLLAPCSLLLSRKGERWGRERFPQLCAEMFKCVKRQSLSPLQPTSCCCHKSGERRGAGSVGGTL